jgi:hypothetical protein
MTSVIGNGVYLGGGASNISVTSIDYTGDKNSITLAASQSVDISAKTAQQWTFDAGVDATVTVDVTTTTKVDSQPGVFYLRNPTAGDRNITISPGTGLTFDGDTLPTSFTAGAYAIYSYFLVNDPDNGLVAVVKLFEEGTL